MRTWFITPDRAPVVWDDAVVGRRALVEIHELTEVAGVLRRSLWATAGDRVSDAERAAAVARTSPDPIPPAPGAPTPKPPPLDPGAYLTVEQADARYSRGYPRQT